VKCVDKPLQKSRFWINSIPKFSVKWGVWVLSAPGMKFDTVTACRVINDVNMFLATFPCVIENCEKWNIDYIKSGIKFRKDLKSSNERS
jgi:hypothetical protein